MSSDPAPQPRPTPQPPPNSPTQSKGQHVFQAPTGTRDLYPADLNRLRYIQDAWRRTSINHGFEEIDGPTFEHLDLYTVKSGEGIVSELFSFERFGGEKKFALRPEFTPTLARMYAARAGSLPKPTKWFWMQNCFRAERPQRGRLREFCQWNCDIIGDDSVAADAEAICCCVGMLESLGLTSKDVRIRVSNRDVLANLLTAGMVPHQYHSTVITFLDKHKPVGPDMLVPIDGSGNAISIVGFFMLADIAKSYFAEVRLEQSVKRVVTYTDPKGNVKEIGAEVQLDLRPLAALWLMLHRAGVHEWCELDLSIVRGLAYYTGMVFEVHEATGAERAIAGGGRYDGLIEMFGGPPTPAVGFGMGDVVLSLVLQDKGLMKSDDEIAHRMGLCPDVYVFAAENRENPEITAAADGAVGPAVARFRREGLHARRSYKSTRNIGKLLGEATKARARFALIIETPTMGQIKHLATGEQVAIAMEEVAGWVKVRVGK